MSDYILLVDVKHQLRVIHDRDDVYIGKLIKAALKHILNFVDRPISEILESDGSYPADLEIAAYLIITDMYQNRAAQTEANLYVNRACENLMLPYKKMGV
ncbi:DNA packaging protein [Acinetobacter sp. Ag2]|uniref:head-tail connector protein n=1 Tax=Acinetobacter sp. Ag2 TaxID=1646532 RepID=UPI0006293778|nr:head-tail connector protein [Acinetobacter sp. Ag2]KKW75745.1 DNA packaging protein [Acinetobacter sp. Ag2]